MSWNVGTKANMYVSRVGGGAAPNTPQLLPVGYLGAIAQFSLHTGSELLDRSGNGYDLAASVVSNWQVRDMVAGASVRFAQTSYINNAGGDWWVLTGPMTFVCRAQVNGDSSAASEFVLAAAGGVGETEAANYLFLLSALRVGGAITGLRYFHEYGVGVDVIFTVPITPNNGDWFFAAVRRTASGVITIQYNGVRASSSPEPLPTTAPGSKELRIRSSPAGAAPLVGAMADANFWDYALSDSELDAARNIMMGLP